MKALFLYTEAAPYLMACLKALAEGHGVDVHLVRWPVNNEAPFVGMDVDGVRVSLHDQRSDDAWMAAVKALAPDIVFVSGWVDKGYLHAARWFRARGVPVVLCSDTAWRGDLRQWANVFLSRLWLGRTFSHAWVTGKIQARYAMKLGFPETRMRTGFYAADTTRFLAMGERLLDARSDTWPHRFLCVARYIPTKGQQLLCDAFASLCDAGDAGDWELWFVGAGEDFEQVRNSPSGRHARIRHLGFKQVDELEDVIAQCGVFVLPSTYEPWGVVVHEQACAGMPMVLSSAVGAAERFLVEGSNGHRSIAGDVTTLSTMLRMMVLSSDPELRDMGQRSHALGASWTPDDWARVAVELMQQR